MLPGSVSVTGCPVCPPEDTQIDALVGNSLKPLKEYRPCPWLCSGSADALACAASFSTRCAACCAAQPPIRAGCKAGHPSENPSVLLTVGVCSWGVLCYPPPSFSLTGVRVNVPQVPDIPTSPWLKPLPGGFPWVTG